MRLKVDLIQLKVINLVWIRKKKKISKTTTHILIYAKPCNASKHKVKYLLIEKCY